MDKFWRAARASGQVNLSDSDLQDIPPEVFDLQKQIDPTTEKWWEIVELQRLLLARNQLTRLPDKFDTLPALTYLDVSANQLTQLPETLASLQELNVLIVSGNKLSSLLPSISRLTNLQRLDVSKNELQSLPDSLCSCCALAELEASQNLLKRLDTALLALPNLTKLNLEKNQIALAMPDVFQTCTRLMELNLSYNNLEALPESIGSLVHLKRLMLFRNKITEIPASIGNCAALADIHLGENRLQTLPSEFSRLSSLGTLSLQSNKIAEFPECILSLNLNGLDISNNDVCELPPELGNMTTLMRLDVQGNPIRTIKRALLVPGATRALLELLRDRIQHDSPPDGCSPLQSPFQRGSAGSSGSRTRSRVSHGTPSGLPCNAQGVSSSSPWEQDAGASARALSSAGDGGEGVGSPVRSIRDALASCELNDGAPSGVDVDEETVKQWRREGAAKHHGLVVLPKKGLKGIPLLAIQRLLPLGQELRGLRLMGNQITDVPGDAGAIAILSTLEELDLSSNKIHAWPGLALRSLPNLKKLVLAYNPLKELPVDALAACSGLETLDITQHAQASGGKGVVPSSFAWAHAPGLTEIHLRGTGFSEFPAGLAELHSLRTLNISQNSITDLPQALNTFALLESLDVSDNQISWLPPELGKLRNLSVLRVEGNPITNVRRSIILKGSKALLDYLRDM